MRVAANDVAKEFGLHATTVAKWVRLSPMSAPAALPPLKNNDPQGPLNATERQELVEFGASCARSRLKGIFWQRLRPGFPARARRCLQRLPARESKPGRSSRASPVRNAQSLRQRVLRLAGLCAEQADPRKQRIERAHRSGPPRQRPDMRHTPYSCGVGRYRGHCQPQAHARLMRAMGIQGPIFDCYTLLCPFI